MAISCQAHGKADRSCLGRNRKSTMGRGGGLSLLEMGGTPSPARTPPRQQDILGSNAVEGRMVAEHATQPWSTQRNSERRRVVRRQDMLGRRRWDDPLQTHVEDSMRNDIPLTWVAQDKERSCAPEATFMANVLQWSPRPQLPRTRSMMQEGGNRHQQELQNASLNEEGWSVGLARETRSRTQMDLEDRPARGETQRTTTGDDTMKTGSTEDARRRRHAEEGCASRVATTGAMSPTTPPRSKRQLSGDCEYCGGGSQQLQEERRMCDRHACRRVAASAPRDGRVVEHRCCSVELFNGCTADSSGMDDPAGWGIGPCFPSSGSSRAAPRGRPEEARPLAPHPNCAAPQLRRCRCLWPSTYCAGQ